ncbi:hypothetical protein D3C72_1002930 [compost metagenome]
MEPAVGIDGLRREVRAPVVALHHIGAAYQQFAAAVGQRGAQAELHIRHHRADRAVGARRIHTGLAHGGRGLRHAVAVVQHDAEGVLERGLERRRERRAARLRHAQRRRAQRLALRAAPFDHFRVHGRHAVQHGELFLDQRARQLLRAETRLVVDRGAVGHRAHQQHGQAIDVRDRQHAIDAVAGLHAGLQTVGMADEHQVGVRQHHRLRGPRGARRIDQRGHLFAGLGGHRLGHGALVDGADQQLADVRPRRRIGPLRAARQAVLARFREIVVQIEGHARAGVLDDIGDLARRQPGVDRHRPRVDGAQRQ